MCHTGIHFSKHHGRRGSVLGFDPFPLDDGLIKLSKLADYGIVIMTHLARPASGQSSAQAIARATRIPQPTTSKILKALARDGLLRSQRGVNGGYELGRAAGSITIAEIIVALDGPIAVTDCVDGAVGSCVIERLCPARTNWEKINAAIRDALDGVTLAEMANGIPLALQSMVDRQPTGAAQQTSMALGSRRPVFRDGSQGGLTTNKADTELG